MPRRPAFLVAAARRLVLPWRGMRETTITHPHFGAEPVAVYAIRVTPNVRANRANDGATGV